MVRRTQRFLFPAMRPRNLPRESAEVFGKRHKVLHRLKHMGLGRGCSRRSLPAIPWPCPDLICYIYGNIVLGFFRAGSQMRGKGVPCRPFSKEGSYRDLLLPRPKEIPRFLIFALNVLAFIPSTSAAPPLPWTLPFVRSRTYFMWRAITSSNNSDSFSEE